MPGDYYGLGFAFPPGVDPTTGSLGIVGDTTVVAQALRVLLRTQPGDRLMRPDYGCDLKQFLFAPNTVSTRRLIEQELRRAITRHEDRARLGHVEVVADDREPAQVNITISYTLTRTGVPGSLELPFRLDQERR
jgi:phage baseplate assembly protein W